MTDTTYTDRYPSGLPYTACGAPHPSPESEWRRCSRQAGHDGVHMNRMGNEWTSVPRWIARKNEKGLPDKDMTGTVAA